ncbi:MAG: flagellar hook capping FlgD N-terminal domain-containing protein [Phycisphaerales bacterium]
MSSISNDLSSRAPSATNAFSAMSSEDFVDIMFTELTNQDPLSPNDTQALMDQIGAIRQIESDLTMTETLEQMVRQNEVTSAGSLISKFVTGRTSEGLPVASYVDSVSVTRQGIILNLNSGARIPMSNVEEIIDPELFELLDDESTDEVDDVEGADDADGADADGDEPVDDGPDDDDDDAGA